MLERKRARRIGFVCSLMPLLYACADFPHRVSAGSGDDAGNAQQALDVDLDQLLVVAGDAARRDPPGRLAECHEQMQAYAQNRQLSGLLRLFAAQLTAEGCGDLAATARAVRAFSRQLTDPRLRDLIWFQLALAERQVSAGAERQRLIRRLDSTRFNLKKALSSSRQALHSSKQAISQTREIYRQMVTRDAEARQLKEKLDALKSIEQDVNDTER